MWLVTKYVLENSIMLVVVLITWYSIVLIIFMSTVWGSLLYSVEYVVPGTL